MMIDDLERYYKEKLENNESEFKKKNNSLKRYAELVDERRYLLKAQKEKVIPRKLYLFQCCDCGKKLNLNNICANPKIYCKACYNKHKGEE